MLRYWAQFFYSPSSLNRDVTEFFEQSRAASPLMDALDIDFDLKTLLATSIGDLLGRSFTEKLLPFATRAPHGTHDREVRSTTKCRSCWICSSYINSVSIGARSDGKNSLTNEHKRKPAKRFPM